MFSYVQIRGSIPLLWKQHANFKQRGRVEVDYDYETQYKVIEKNYIKLIQ